MSYSVFAQISLDRETLTRSEVDAIYREMAGPEDSPHGAYIYINGGSTPEEYFAPYLKQLNAMGIRCHVTVFEPREIDFEYDEIDHEIAWACHAAGIVVDCEHVENDPTFSKMLYNHRLGLISADALVERLKELASKGCDHTTT